MSIYPQLTSGALSQFPTTKRVQTRTVINAMADGSSIRLADVNGASLAWKLQYTGLSDAELSNLQQFFEDCEGSLSQFTFLDPAGNLLAWSEDLTNAAWHADPLLSVASGAADPFGKTQAFTLGNSGGAAQGITQTLNAPAGYVYSLSVYVLATQAVPVTLAIGGQTKTGVAGANWTRISFTSVGNSSGSSTDFSIEAGPGTITVFGPQVEAQPAASAYKTSTIGGVFENARFNVDSLKCTATGVNQNSVTTEIYVTHF
jgi:hypothetical protein